MLISTLANSFDWPTTADLLETLTLRQYNTRLVVLATAILGAACGVTGTFLLLRKRALMGDALAHATLPGIGLMFLVLAAVFGIGEKSLPLLLIGATVFGLLGVGMVMAIEKTTRLKDDAAMGIVLSVFFGLGVAVLRVVQDLPDASQAGLDDFIYGKPSALIWLDLVLLTVVAIAAIVVCLLFFKELTLLCFDDDYTASLGFNATLLDAMLMLLITAVVVVGLQAVGLILVIAMLIIPPAAARFWSNRLWMVTTISAVIGAVSGWIGATLSALMADLPAGSIIVLAAAVMFAISMLFGPARGVVRRMVRHIGLRQRIGRQHLLRAMLEQSEAREAKSDHETPGAAAIGFDQLLDARSWRAGRLRRLLRRAQRARLIRPAGEEQWVLTDHGRREAQRVVRNHRLWELYLITHADVAASHVDQDADRIEHVLDPALVERLERILDGAAPPPLPSPHALDHPAQGEGGRR